MNYQNSQSLKILSSYLEKSKEAQIGETRVWGGNKIYKKTHDGWEYVSDTNSNQDSQDSKQSGGKTTPQRKKALLGLAKAKAERFLKNEFKDKEFDKETVQRIVQVMLKYKRSKSNFY